MPDPASPLQPDDVHGPSEVIEPCVLSTGKPPARLEGPAVARMPCFSRLHAGTFTAGGHVPRHDRQARPSGRDRLHRARTDAGRRFAGRWNWGYDGVLLLRARRQPTAGRTICKASDRCSPCPRGLMVFLDVVYNHFGPEGNYLGRYAPRFFFTQAQHAVGRRDRLSRSTAVRRFRHRERAALAERLSASTACGSTLSTPSSSRARPSAARTEPKPSARSPPKSGRHHSSGAGERRQPARACSRRTIEPARRKLPGTVE